MTAQTTRLLLAVLNGDLHCTGDNVARAEFESAETDYPSGKDEDDRRLMSDKQREYSQIQQTGSRSSAYCRDRAAVSVACDTTYRKETNKASGHNLPHVGDAAVFGCKRKVDERK